MSYIRLMKGCMTLLSHLDCRAQFFFTAEARKSGEK
jgi:hypothetical protein